MWHGEFRHPRLVEVYDAECPWSVEDDFFLSVVKEVAPTRVLDLGCGTGRLTLALADAGYHSQRNIPLRDGTKVHIWTEVTAVDNGAVSFNHHYAFADGERIPTEAMLRFRSEDELRSSLTAAGFAIDAIYGDWQREPVGTGDGELLVLARA